MKKVLIILGIICVISIIIFSINMYQKNNNEDFNVDIDKLVEDLKNSQIFDDNLEEIEKNIIIKKYMFNEEKIETIKCYLGSGATSEEILIIKLNEKNYMNDVRKLIENKIEESKILYKDYLPKEVFKLENYNLISKGNYIILCISNNYNKSKEIIEQHLNI